VGAKTSDVSKPCFSPPSQPFPATASAEGLLIQGGPFPASATAEGRQLNGAPSPAREEGVKGPGQRGEKREMHGPGHGAYLLTGMLLSIRITILCCY